LICCLSTQISASSVARARIRSTSVQKISLQRSITLGSISRFVSARQLDSVYDRDSVDDVDVTSRCAALDGGGRHRDDIMQRLHQKLRVDELIRKQRIVELRSHFHGTGGGIDLAVIAATPAGCEHFDVGAVVGEHFKECRPSAAAGPSARPLSERQGDAHCGFAYFVGEHAILDRARQHHTANA
jgi:hypothetical protein